MLTRSKVLRPLRSARTRPADLLLTLARISLGLLLASAGPTASATFSISRCCTLAAREEFHDHFEDFWPWEVCSFGEDIDYATNDTLPSITRSMGWAKQNCRGTQYSSLEQWLIPLSTYISPYIGILLLCPVGDAQSVVFVAREGWGWVNSVVAVVREYMCLLGDPASAVFGALHEVWADVRAVRKLDSRDMAWRERSALWIAVLSGNLVYSPDTKWDPEVAAALDALSETTREDEPKAANVVTETTVRGSEAALMRNTGTAADRISTAVETLILARKGFVNSILIPVLLMLAVTAATFYDAYSKRGDKDTGLALAYCVWYSWILVLAVAGNSSVGSFSPDITTKALYKVVDLGGVSSTSLRHRFVNSHLWRSWASSRDLCLESNWKLWLRFCVGQLVGFCCVAFTSACAAAISWTTPTTGLGCRSFNFILYVILSFVTAYLHVLSSWLSIRSAARGAKKDIPLWVVRFLYWLLVLANSLVMVLGTLFHLVGVFRTCWCEQLTWDESTQIELNSKTAQAVDNSRRYWLSTAYVAFGGVWLACLTTILFRGFIVRKLQAWVDARK